VQNVTKIKKKRKKSFTSML